MKLFIQLLFVGYSLFYLLYLLPLLRNYSYPSQSSILYLGSYFVLLGLILGLIYDNFILGVTPWLYQRIPMNLLKLIHMPRYILHVTLLPGCYICLALFLVESQLFQDETLPLYISCTILSLFVIPGLLHLIPNFSHFRIALDTSLQNYAYATIMPQQFATKSAKVKEILANALPPTLIVVASMICGIILSMYPLVFGNLFMFLVAAAPLSSHTVKAAATNFGEIIFMSSFVHSFGAFRQTRA